MRLQSIGFPYLRELSAPARPSVGRSHPHPVTKATESVLRGCTARAVIVGCCLSGWETLCVEQKNSGYSVNGSFAQYALA